jgi:uncharacterized protein (DUF1778 family)
MYCQAEYTIAMVEPRSDRLQLRVSAQQHAIIQLAADASHQTVTDYVVRHAVSAAKNDLADRRFFALDGAWDQFQALLDRPVVRKPELEKLFSGPEPWAD